MCNCLETIKEQWDQPFVIPIIITEQKDLKSGPWAVNVFNMTKSGSRISSLGKGTLFINYCPICGEKLAKEE